MTPRSDTWLPALQAALAKEGIMFHLLHFYLNVQIRKRMGECEQFVYSTSAIILEDLAVEMPRFFF